MSLDLAVLPRIESIDKALVHFLDSLNLPVRGARISITRGRAPSVVEFRQLGVDPVAFNLVPGIEMVIIHVQFGTARVTQAFDLASWFASPPQAKIVEVVNLVSACQQQLLYAHTTLDAQPDIDILEGSAQVIRHILGEQ